MQQSADLVTEADKAVADATATDIGDVTVTQ
jgi:hypothetical protein